MKELILSMFLILILLTSCTNKSYFIKYDYDFKKIKKLRLNPFSSDKCKYKSVNEMIKADLLVKFLEKGYSVEFDTNSAVDCVVDGCILYYNGIYFDSDFPVLNNYNHSTHGDYIIYQEHPILPSDVINNDKYDKYKNAYFHHHEESIPWSSLKVKERSIFLKVFISMKDFKTGDVIWSDSINVSSSIDLVDAIDKATRIILKSLP